MDHFDSLKNYMNNLKGGRKVKSEEKHTIDDLADGVEKKPQEETWQTVDHKNIYMVGSGKDHKDLYMIGSSQLDEEVNLKPWQINPKLGENMDLWFDVELDSDTD